jgi:riboflavin synthase
MIFIKGFIAVDGSSLTVGDVDTKQAIFTLHLIPETLRLTNFGNKKINDRVNIEIDHKTQTIVTTVENFLQARGC